MSVALAVVVVGDPVQSHIYHISYIALNVSSSPVEDIYQIHQLEINTLVRELGTLSKKITGFFGNFSQIAFSSQNTRLKERNSRSRLKT